MVPANRESLITQMRRGTLEYCVLALLRDQPRYGFDLVRTLGGADGLVTTTWHESPSGPPRRYYELTADGRRALALFSTEWDRFTDAVDRLLRQGGSP